VSSEPLLIRDAEVAGHGTTDCLVRNGVIAAIGPHPTSPPGIREIAANGGALIPGLADHHLHLTATAAAARSVDLAGLARHEIPAALRAAPRDAQGWVRVLGYDDVRHGALDRQVLDAWAPGPLRVQHRSGALWILSSAGLASVGAAGAGHPGIERAPDGEPTGLLWRADDWLRSVVAGDAPDLGELGGTLARHGITHVTDATPGDGHVDLIASAVLDGALPQHVMVMASSRADVASQVMTGPVKIVTGDHALPSLEELVDQVRAARRQQRAVAVHCVTEVALALTLAALDEVGAQDGDRIEHAAVAPAALIVEIAARGLRVVTQPSMITRRGDDYLARADDVERPALWPHASLVAAGIRVATSSDAPYGDLDPWATVRAAASRTTASGQTMGAQERVDPIVTLRGLWSSLDDPGGPERVVDVGAPADLVLLDRPLRAALREPSADHVRATIIRGAVIHGG